MVTSTYRVVLILEKEDEHGDFQVLNETTLRATEEIEVATKLYEDIEDEHSSWVARLI